MKPKAGKEVTETVKLTVNGKEIERQVRPDLTLLRFLRDDLKLTGTKDGCSQGHCGTCTVIIDGKAVRSCSQKVSNLGGKNIETIENLSSSGKLHPIQQAFLSAGAVQCGFCTPGMIMAAKALLDKNPCPSHEEIMEGLKNNLCRCTGYVKIIDAVKVASELMQHPQAYAIKEFCDPSDVKLVGFSLPDVDGASKVKGELTFADDIYLPHMGYGKILWSTYPHAEILSLDASEAKKMPGVRAVLTAKDVPGRNGYGILRPDQPVLADKKVRFLGDPVALVVADSAEQAKKAVESISVQYRELKGVFSPEEALRPDAPLLYENGNIMREIKHLVGDVEKAFLKADLIVEKDYSTPFIDHAFLEPESAVASLSVDGKIRVSTCTQMPFEFRAQIAGCLGMPEEKVRVVATPLGGGFGGKVSLTIQALAALGELRTGRPVKISLTREESLRFHTKKHASTLHYKTGFAKNGKIVANHTKITLDAGPYTDASPIVLDQACIFSSGPYEIENVKIEGLAAYTNNANGGPMRGFGINQSNYAMELQLDIAARELGLNPFDLRLTNALEVGKSTVTGEILRASAPIKETIKAAKEALTAMAPVKSGKKVGVGMASGFKNVGAGKGSVDNGGAITELIDGGKLRIYVSSVDMGQGNRTAMVQLCANEFGICQDTVEIITGDTDLVLKAVGVVGERATYCSGNAVVLGVREFKKALLNKVSEELNIPGGELDCGKDGVIRKNGTYVSPVLSYDELYSRLSSKGEHLRVQYNYRAPKTFPISTAGIPSSSDTVLDRYAPQDQVNREEYRNYPSYSYITSVAVVEVDEQTGEVKVRKVISAVDVGRAINPQRIEGQVEGSIVMGMGYALSEKYELLNGAPITTDLRKCGIMRIDAAPEVTTLIIEDEDPGGPYGAKGVSEVATVPVTPAIINAIYDATGVRIYDLPATPDKVLKALRSRTNNNG